MHGVMLDITELKQAQAELQQAKDAAEARAEQLATLNRVAQTVASVRDLPTTLRGMADEMVQIFNARNSGIALVNPERTALVVVAGAVPTRLIGTAMRITRSIATL